MHGDYHVINITSVIARVSRTLSTTSVPVTPLKMTPQHRSSPTKTVETVRTYALLSIQQDQQLLDNPDCNAVRMLLWTSAKLMTLLNMNFFPINMNFLLINQRMLPLNPIIINWYLNFLKDRKQQLNNFGCDWKPVNKGTL